MDQTSIRDFFEKKIADHQARLQHLRTPGLRYYRGEGHAPEVEITADLIAAEETAISEFTRILQSMKNDNQSPS